MTLSAFDRRGRLFTALAACGLLLGGCVLATAYGGPTVALPGGKTVALKPGEFVVPPATIEGWRRQLGESKVRLLARCSYDTGLCTTVVVPLVTTDPVAPTLPGVRCRDGEVAVDNAPDGRACLAPLLFDLGKR